MRSTEAEVKLETKDRMKVKRWLLRKRAEYLGKARQGDYYFDPPDRTFKYTDKDGLIRADNYLRVRFEDGSSKGILCFKRYRPSRGKSDYVQKMETEVADGDGLMQMLTELGFKRTCVIDKLRETFRYYDFIIVFDRAHDLAGRLEIKYTKKGVDAVEGRKMIDSLIREMGITDWKPDEIGYVIRKWNRDKFKTI